MDKMDKIESLTSADIVAQNIETLKQLFPTIVREGKIDEVELKAILGEYIEEKEEFYRFTWTGKSAARAEANKPSTATLRPDKASSKDWDTTGNLFIEGDNLEVLKLLQKSYSNKIKMIYIDPPYNTGKDFVYKDNYKDNLANYLEQSGQLDVEGRKTSTNSESDGRYHSNWLSMMYPRLRLARNLMTEDGVIFISIDDNEQANLKKLCDEVFGEENHIANLIWQNKKGGGNDAKHMAVEHEYVILYAKSETSLHHLFEPYKASYLTRYKEQDEIGYFFWDTFKRKSGKQYYPITCPDGTILQFDEYNNEISWLRSEERFKKDLEDNEVRFVKNGNSWSIHFKQRLPQGKKPRSIFLEESILESKGTTSTGSQEALDIFKKHIFSNPKPTTLLNHFMSFALHTDSLILDFFAGSGTTAHAVMQLNAEDGGNRKCISVQLPEPTNEKSEAFKAGYSVISDITKERIRRAGEKIKADNKGKEGIDKLDVGFKAFKLDSSNINAWDSSKDALEAQLNWLDQNNGENIKVDRSEEDVLYEILLKYGLDLSVAVEKREVANTPVYNIGYGSLFICLATSITTEVAEGIGTWKTELEPATCRVIFKDTGFATDADKTNCMQILKRFHVTEVKSI